MAKEKPLSEKTFTEDGMRVVDWENVKQFIKEILEEIELLYVINEENSLKSGISEKLRQIVLLMLDDVVDTTKQIIKQKAGFEE